MSFWACTIFITWHRNIWHWKIVLRLSSSWCAQVNAKQDCSGLPVVPRAKNIIRQISNSRMNFLEMDSCKITLSSEHFGTAKMTSIQKRKKNHDIHILKLILVKIPWKRKIHLKIVIFYTEILTRKVVLWCFIMIETS